MHIDETLKLKSSRTALSLFVKDARFDAVKSTRPGDSIANNICSVGKAHQECPSRSV